MDTIFLCISYIAHSVVLHIFDFLSTGVRCLVGALILLNVALTFFVQVDEDKVDEESEHVLSQKSTFAVVDLSTIFSWNFCGF